MDKSFKFLLIFLTLFVFVGLINNVSASELSSAVALDDSSLSSDFSEDIAIVNDNIIHVSNSGSDELGDGSLESPYASLSHAIDKSKNNYVICLNGSFSGVKNSNLIIDKNLSIVSNGMSYIIGDSQSRLFNVSEGCTLSVCNLSFSSFDVSKLNADGGVIYSYGDLIVENCEFKSCVANNGGAIYSKGKLFINNSSFNLNRAFVYGGAVYCLGNGSLINNSYFKENCAKSKTTEVSGGAIANYGINFTVLHSMFEGNYAKETSKVENEAVYGGAISNFGSGFYVYDCDFLTNYVEIRTDAGSGESCLNVSEGGAIYTVSDVKVENSRFDKNTAHCKYSSNQVNIYGNRCFGAAISILNGSGFYLLNNTFVNCSAANGVVKNLASNGIFENNTFANGKSMFRGSAVYDVGENNIYRGNTFLNNNDSKNHAQGTVYVSARNVTFENNAFLNNYDTSGSVHSSNNAAIYIYNPSFAGGSDAKDTNIKILNNNFDGNDRGIYLYCPGGVEISGNSFTNQKLQAIDTYVGRDVSILNNYFENNHGYHGAVDINSVNTLIRGNSFVNNVGTIGGAIGILCRDGITIDSNSFIGNHATNNGYGGGDLYSLYGDLLLTNNHFVVDSKYNGESSIFTDQNSLYAINNTFVTWDNTHKIINQIGHLEYFLNNIIYDNTPVNKDGSVTNSSVEDLIDLNERTDNDFNYYRNATPNNAELEDDSTEEDEKDSEEDNSHDQSSESSDSKSKIEEILDKINEFVDDVIDSYGGEGSNSSSLSQVNKTDYFASDVADNSSDVGKSHEIAHDQSNSGVAAVSSNSEAVSQEEPRGTAYDISKHQNVLNSPFNKYIVIILAILLIYVGYRNKKEK